MNQKSKTCRFCGGRLVVDIETSISGAYYSGFFRERINELAEGTVSSARCSKCGIEQWLNGLGDNILAGLSSGAEYREPTGHEIGILEILLEDVDCVAASQLQLYSMKDLKYKEIIGERTGGTSTSTSGRRIHIMNRYVEHINQQATLEQTIESVEIDDLLVIEMLDYARLTENGSASYLWNERVTYPTCSQIDGHMKARGFSLLGTRQYKSGLEPFFVSVYKRVRKGCFEGGGEESSVEILKPAVEILRNNCLDVCIEAVKGGREIVFIGAGHKTLTVVGVLKSLEPELLISIYDSDRSKYGVELGGTRIQNLERLTVNSATDAYVSFGGDNGRRLTETLKRNGSYSVRDLQGSFLEAHKRK